MMIWRSKSTVMLALALGATLVSGCAKVRTHQGYIHDRVITNTIEPGVDNRDSVQRSLGNPTFVGVFDPNKWYYFGRNSRQFSYDKPRVRNQDVLAIQFDEAGNVVAVERSGVDQVASINPSGSETPTLGRKSSLLDEIFGNVGAVGSPLGGAGQGTDPTRP